MVSVTTILIRLIKIGAGWVAGEIRAFAISVIRITYFKSYQPKMFSQSVLLYGMIGAVAFATLGVVAAYYRDDKPDAKSIARDFISGASITLSTRYFVPSMFPDITNLTVPLPSIQDVVERSKSFGGGGGKDFDLQL